MAFDPLGPGTRVWLAFDELVEARLTGNRKLYGKANQALEYHIRKHGASLKEWRDAITARVEEERHSCRTA